MRKRRLSPSGAAALILLGGLTVATLTAPTIGDAKLADTTDTEVEASMATYPPASVQARWWLDGSFPLTVFKDHECTTTAIPKDEVHCWQDRKVEQNKLIHVGSEVKVPTLKADAINGRAAVNFYHGVLAGDDRFHTYLDQASIFLVFKENERTPPGGSDAVLVNVNGKSRGNRFSIVGPHHDGYIYFDSGTYKPDSTEARSRAPALPIGEVTLVTAWKDQGRRQSGLQINDGDAFCSSGNPPAETVGGLRMGDYVENTDVGELIVVANRLEAHEEQIMEAYLIEKWGIERAVRSDPPPEPDCYTPPPSTGGWR